MHTARIKKIKLLTYSILAGFAFGAVFILNGLQRPDANQRPNVLIILLDAARADHFSCYGHSITTTPHIDELARQGVLFRNAFSQGTNTNTFIPLFFSSRYFSLPLFQNNPWHYEIRQERRDLIFRNFDSAQTFLPTLFSAAGYETALFHGHTWFTEDSRLVRLFDHVCYVPVKRSRPTEHVIIQRLISWVRHKRSQPFFVYCHILSPHYPFPPKPEDREVSDASTFPLLEQARAKISESYDKDASGWTKDDLQGMSLLYDSNLKHTDKCLGVLFDALKRYKLLENTVIVITADHGEDLGEHGFLSHSCPPWDSVIHVPLIMRYPKAIPRHERVEGFVESIDIAPTLIDICNIPMPENKSFDGVSVLPLIKGNNQGKTVVFTQDSIRTPHYKYIISEDLLYDIQSDPGESLNIATSHKPLREKLRKAHDEFLEPFRRRFISTTRRAGLSEPFYYPTHQFSITFQHGAQVVIHERDEDRALLFRLLETHQWIQSVTWKNFGVYFIPRATPIASTLSARTSIPNGRYEIAAFFEIPDSILLEPEQLGLDFQLQGKDSFSPAVSLKKVREYSQVGRVGCYVLLGEAEIVNELFTVKMRIDTSQIGGRNDLYVLRYIKFSPLNENNNGTPEVSEKVLRERQEGLRSLGYL